MDPIRTTLGDALGALAGPALAGVARLRGAKAFHPLGEVSDATLEVHGSPAAPRAARLLAEEARHRAIVRVSRAIGLPPPLPDIFGLAIRVPDAYGAGAHQDLLLVTSLDAPVGHHLLIPTLHPQRRSYSSLTPFGAGGERFLVGARPQGPGRFTLAVAPLSGRLRTVATLTLGERRDEEIRFDPIGNNGGGIEPLGLINRTRRLAYPRAQRGWAG